MKNISLLVFRSFRVEENLLKVESPEMLFILLFYSHLFHRVNRFSSKRLTARVKYVLHLESFGSAEIISQPGSEPHPDCLLIRFSTEGPLIHSYSLVYVRPTLTLFPCVTPAQAHYGRCH